jgi:hypothetical protein
MYKSNEKELMSMKNKKNEMTNGFNQKTNNYYQQLLPLYNSHAKCITINTHTNYHEDHKNIQRNL